MAQMPQSEGIEDGLRRQVKLVPEIVVRELVANALIGRRVGDGGGVLQPSGDLEPR
jgi:predicted HTH transcriptional regulator